MAPELIEGKALDFRTDVFAVGIMLYQLATGQLPFAGKNPHEVLRRIVEGKFPDPRTLNRRFSDGLSRIVNRALARVPADRYPTLDRFTSDLREHLAEAGLTDVKAELRAFFADPDAYEKALPARLALGLQATADIALRARKPAKAIEAWNRVLAFDPDNADVLAALRRLEGRERTRKVVGLGAVALGLTAALLGLGRVATKPKERTQPRLIVLGEKPTPTVPKTAARPPVAEVARTPPEAKDETHRRVPAARVAREPARPAARTFTLGPTPQNVDVYLDGQKQFSYDTDHKTLTVPWTEDHVVEFRSPAGCCFVERVELGPDRPVPPDEIIARRLKWRPASLRLSTEPAVGKEARIMVRDPNRPGAGTLAHAGEDVDVPFSADDEASKEMEISVDTGDGFTSERVTVRAGQRLSHVVKLKTSN
jgi:serine/threonine-protein kinase